VTRDGNRIVSARFLREHVVELRVRQIASEGCRVDVKIRCTTFQLCLNVADRVDGALEGRPDGCHDQRWILAVLRQAPGQISCVHAAIRVYANNHRVEPEQVAEDLHRVVGLRSVVELRHPSSLVLEQSAAHVESVLITVGATVRHEPPSVAFEPEQR